MLCAEVLLEVEAFCPPPPWWCGDEREEKIRLSPSGMLLLLSDMCRTGKLMTEGKLGSLRRAKRVAKEGLFMC